MTDDEQQLHQLHNELARLREETRLLNEEVTGLRRFIRSLQNLADVSDKRPLSTDVMDVLEQILRNALDAINAEDGSLLVRDEDTGELVFVLAMGDIPQDKLAGLRLAPGQGIAGWVAEHREPTIVEDAHTDKRFYRGVDDTFEFYTRTVLAAPILGGGRVLGVIEVLNKQVGRGFTVDDLSLLMLVCRFAGELLHSLEEQVAASARAAATG